MNSNLDNLTKKEIKDNIKNFYSRLETLDIKNDYHELRNLLNNPISAAVLVPLQRINTSWHIVFIHRNPEMNEHAGQVGFPGGHRNNEDISLKDTALREAWEEIGLAKNDVNILGRLPETFTVTNYKISPYVGYIPYPYEFHLSPDEVVKVFTIPIHWLMDKSNYSYVTKNLGNTPEPVRVIYYKPYKGELLWGASARIAHLLLSALTQEK